MPSNCENRYECKNMETLKGFNNKSGIVIQ